MAQSLHQAWGPSAREGEQASQLGKQPQDAEATAEKTERQRDLLNRLYEALPTGQGPDLLKELAGSLGTAAAPQPAQEQQAAPPTPEGEGVEASGPKKTLQAGQGQVAGPLRPPRGRGLRGGGPGPQLTGGPGGGSSRKDGRPPHRGGRSRAAVRRVGKPKRFP